MSYRSPFPTPYPTPDWYPRTISVVRVLSGFDSYIQLKKMKIPTKLYRETENCFTINMKVVLINQSQPYADRAKSIFSSTTRGFQQVVDLAE